MNILKSIISLGLLFSLSLFAFNAKGQKKFYENEEEVIEAAYLALENSIKEGDFDKFIEKYEIKGSFTFDITIKGKGEVASLMAVDREGEVMDQNRLKDYLMGYRFPFKMPKHKSYKFQYQFKF